MTPLPPRELEKGMHGEDVRRLQKSLITCGYGKHFRNRADGHFGEGTEDAVQAFQRAHGLKADGVAGATTMRVLAREKVKKIAAEVPAEVKEAVQAQPHTGEETAPETEAKKPLIVLDPGHGFYVLTRKDQKKKPVTGKKVGDVVYDMGTTTVIDLPETGKTITRTEADMILPIAHALREELEEQGFDVLMTRSKPSDQLPNRYDARSALGAGRKQLHLTVHIDHNINPDIAGIRTYHKKKASQGSIAFARALADNSAYTREHGRTAMLVPELLGTVPSAVLEVGNVMNADDKKRILTSEGQLDIAETVAQRIVEHYDSMRAKNPKLPARQPVEKLEVAPAPETGTDLPSPLPNGGSTTTPKGTQR